MKERRRFRVLLFFVMALVVVLSVPVFGASHKSEWTSSKGNYYYWNAKGKKVKGLQKIGSKYYFFDSKYIQRTGWRKIKGSYYYFSKNKAKKGYMVKNKTMDGVKLNADGKAVLTSRSQRKLKIMVRCSEIMDTLTNADQTKAQKLKIAFDYAKNHYRAVNIHGFRGSGDWDMYYAEYMLNNGRGDCYCYGAVFAYLANAAGYHSATVVSSGGHGWAEINGLFYDPNWARVIGTNKCYAVPRSLSGVSSRPNWARYGIYKKNLSVL